MTRGQAANASAGGDALVRLGVAAFLQMLPSTLVTPAIRPLLALHHGGSEPAMHAFAALNMLGAILAAPFVGPLADKVARPRRLLALLAAMDAVLLAVLVLPMPTVALLGLRMVEGAVHVGAATLLLAEAAALAKTQGRGKAMGIVGAGVLLAVALGSALGGVLVGAFGAPGPFLGGAALAAVVAGLAQFIPEGPRPERTGTKTLLPPRPLVVPLGAVFVARFAVGCLIVTFALFVRQAHGASDREVGFFFSTMLLPFALSIYPLSRLADRLPAAAMLAVGALSYAALLLSFGVLPKAGLWPALFLAGITCSMLFAPTLRYAATFGGGRAAAMAWVNAAGALGMLLGPAAALVIRAIAKSGENPLFWHRSVFAFAAACVVAWLVLSTPWLLARWKEERGERAAELAAARAERA